METPNIERLIAGWNDQKLAEVFAFNQDGKMEFYSPCGCLTGVHSTAVGALHTIYCYRDHYRNARWIDPGCDVVRDAELEYLKLGLDRTPVLRNDEAMRRRGLDAILRAEMERRE